MADAGSARSPRTIVIAAAVDVVAVLVFVALGRSSHHESGSFVHSTLRVAAPFLIGLAVGWLVSRAWTAPLATRTGVVIWISTLAVGMVLRHFPFHKGTALSFVIVASCFTCLFLVGWRLAAMWWMSRKTASP